MLFSALAVSSLLVSVAVAAPEPAPYRIGTMSVNPAFGLAKRQAGYQPTQTYCNAGNTCAEACGAGYVQCPSNDGNLHCYDPAIQDTCCPDGTGNSCAEGYFCTQDASGGTWCCPNGMSLAACAAAYSLTGTLVSETGTVLPTGAASSSSSVSASTTSAPPTVSSSSTIPSTTSIASISSTSVATNATITYVTPTTSKTSQFTGAANANSAIGGLLVLGVAGVFAAL